MCQGRQSRRVGGGGHNPPPPELAVDKLGGVEHPPLILREYLENLITYVILYRLYSIGGGGGGWLTLN